jgi:hypothetical protein
MEGEPVTFGDKFFKQSNDEAIAGTVDRDVRKIS